MTQYRTIEGDVLDLIIWRELDGRGPDALAAVLDVNPHIRGLDAHLPIGTLITLPVLDVVPVKTVVRLFD